MGRGPTRFSRLLEPYRALTEDAKIALMETQLFNKVVKCQDEAEMFSDKDKISYGLSRYYQGKADAYTAVFSLLKGLFDDTTGDDSEASGDNI